MGEDTIMGEGGRDWRFKKNWINNKNGQNYGGKFINVYINPILDTAVKMDKKTVGRKDSNAFKRYPKWNYCYSFGGDLEDLLTSALCLKRKKITSGMPLGKKCVVYKK